MPLLGSLSPQRRRLLLSVVAAVVVAAAALTAYAALTARADDTPSAPQDEPGPVVLVPGYGGSGAVFDELAGLLRDRGREVSVLDLPGDGTGDLRTQADALDELVRSTLSRTGAGSVDVVAHSAGGVVARIWVRDDGGDALARRVVTLGSPHHGAEIAELAGAFPVRCSAGCEQLAPGSDLLRALNAGDETPAGPAYVAVWSETDDVVRPVESASLAGALDVPVQRMCPGESVSHGALPSNPAVEALVVAALGPGPPSVPADPPCG